MSLAEILNKRKNIKRAKAILTDREFQIYKALSNNPLGLTPEEIKAITGYSYSGWVYSSFKEKGYQLRNCLGVISLEQY